MAETTNEAAEREAFQHEHAKLFPYHTIYACGDDGEYIDIHCQLAFKLWRAARAQSAAPEVVKPETMEAAHQAAADTLYALIPPGKLDSEKLSLALNLRRCVDAALSALPQQPALSEDEAVEIMAPAYWAAAEDKEFSRDGLLASYRALIDSGHFAALPESTGPDCDDHGNAQSGSRLSANIIKSGRE